LIDGPLEEKAATFGATASSPVTVRAGAIFATGDLLKTVIKDKLDLNATWGF